MLTIELLNTPQVCRDVSEAVCIGRMVYRLFSYDTRSENFVLSLLMQSRVVGIAPFLSNNFVLWSDNCWASHGGQRAHAL